MKGIVSIIEVEHGSSNSWREEGTYEPDSWHCQLFIETHDFQALRSIDKLGSILLEIVSVRSEAVE